MRLHGASQPIPRARPRRRPAAAGPSRRRRGRGGFTLIEAAIVMMIVGVGVMGTLQLIAAGTMANTESAELTTAMHLAGNIRETMLEMKFADDVPTTPWGVDTGETTVKLCDDLDDFDGRTFSPPLDIQRNVLATYGTWSQSVEVNSADENRVTLDQGKDVSNPIARVTVRVSRAGKVVYTTSWLVANPNPD